MEDPGVKIADRLAAVITGGKLFFRSYNRTNQFLDLTDHFREASDHDITTILKHDKITKTNAEYIISLCRPMMRKKFSAIMFTGVLDKAQATPERIQAGMRRFFEVAIEIKTKPSGDQQIVFPTDPMEMSHLLEYLTDSVYESDLTGEHRSSNSHRPLD
jgi:hypothetical protein